MKVVHICHTDIKWGASRAAFGIFNSLKNLDTDTTMLVQKKYSTDEKVLDLSSSWFEDKLTKSRIILDLMPMYIFTKRSKGRFSFGSIGKDITKHRLIKEADVINLHWINEGFLSIKNISELNKINKPLFWTLHDMWTFTGGCHYAGSCIRYLDSCGLCPYLKTPGEKDFSYRILKKKKKLLKKIKLTIITPSRWLKECAEKSSLLKDFPVEVIPYAIDLNLYKPSDKIRARKDLKLPDDKILILFGSMSAKDERKGFRFFKKSLSVLYNQKPQLRDQIKILVFGRADEEMKKDIPFEILFWGRISGDKTLVSLYNASDFFVAPSTEDNYPNTVMESLACGLPVVAFNIGGLPDMISHKKNGFLATPQDAESLMEGINWLISNKGQIDLRETARKLVVERNNPERISELYFQLYKNAIKKISGNI
jgi:glycosyltransferase involved in cell wall biosynthesis